MIESEPFPPQQESYSARPVMPPIRIWSLGFIGVVVLIALLGAIIAFFGVSAMADDVVPVVNFTPGNLVFLVFAVGLMAACLAGLWFARNWLLRAGLLLQVGTAAATITNQLVGLQVIKITPSTTLFFSLGLLASVFNLLSLVCLSYGLARWQSSDAVFLPLQILFALGLGILALGKFNPPASIQTQLAIGMFCDIAAILVLLARPASWKAGPLIVFCLIIGRLLDKLYYVFFIGPFPQIATSQPFQLFYGLGLGATLLFLLGLLLLAQTERARAAR